ncbi:MULTISPECIES: hypothetical protein [Sorangium]|uniref:Secreted protein n=1 Tax=Sorangium cellulosum TaxID=56 RepID=A0A4P2QMQ0_SORCE|nr:MULTISPECIES: hypothetical protein [Sorangium]AUX31285.1 hypothetical protein SOCE836_034140 [Sorangium cellulosum]WCQ90669.1 hypothetical protein NQZ70_03380 [Sorangium sp. Soce836]
MTLRYPCVTALLAVPLATAACIGAELEEEPDELVGVAEGEMISENGYVANALSVNALSVNALSVNALSVNALSVNALSVNALSAITDPGPNGAPARELLRYLVSCALRADQTFSFSWTDSDGVAHPEVYRGDLGYAHWWAALPLGTGHTYVQSQLSACLAARANWYGVSVRISLRNNEMPANQAERAAFTVREGAFWGNLFSSSPYLRACYSPGGVTRARQLQRDCAAGHLSVDPATGATTVQQCGPMVIVGSCDAMCNGMDSVNGYYRGCLQNPSVSTSLRTDVVVTSYLPPAP